jgi:hypothetical protein
MTGSERWQFRTPSLSSHPTSPQSLLGTGQLTAHRPSPGAAGRLAAGRRTPGAPETAGRHIRGCRAARLAQNRLASPAVRVKCHGGWVPVGLVWIVAAVRRRTCSSR